MPTDPSVIDARTSANTPLPFVDLQLAGASWMLDGSVHSQIFVPMPVATQVGALPIWVADRHLYTLDRDSAGNPARIPRKIDGTAYNCTEAALEAPVADDAAKSYWDKSKAYVHAGQQVFLSHLIARDNTAATLALNTAVIDNAAATAVYSTDSTDVIQELVGIIEDRATLLGVDPSALNVFIPAKAWKAIKRNATVKAALLTFFSGAGVNSLNMQPMQFAAMLGCGKVIIGRLQKDTANPSKTQVLAPIWDKTKILIYLPSTPQYEMIGFGKMVSWAGGLDPSDIAMATGAEVDPALLLRTDMYRDERATSDIVRVRDYKQFLITNAKAAYIVTGVVGGGYT